MEKEQLPWPERRQIIHDLSIRLRTGLSPPEECIQEYLEAQENSDDNSRSD